MFSDAEAPSTDIPPLRLSWFAPGARVTTDWKSRPFGSRSIVSDARLVAADVCFTSIVAVWAETLTISLTPARASAKSTFSKTPTATVTGGCLTGVKPSNDAMIS